MQLKRILCGLLVISATCATTVNARWMQFSGGPVTAFGVWPASALLNGGAIVTANNFTNGIPSTAFIGLTPITVNNLSPDYFAQNLQPNPGPVVTMIGTPYNDTGDKYHVVVDFSPTSGGNIPGTFPAGGTFAIIDLDIHENYRNVKATDVSGNPITTPWISGPNAYFDMTNPMTVNPGVTNGSFPTFTGPVAGVYQMLGVSWNDDAEMWLFKTTQNVKTIAFDMEVTSGQINAGTGGAGWAFYSPPVPEPTAMALACGALAISSCAIRPRRRS